MKEKAEKRLQKHVMNVSVNFKGAEHEHSNMWNWKCITGKKNYQWRFKSDYGYFRWMDFQQNRNKNKTPCNGRDNNITCHRSCKKSTCRCRHEAGRSGTYHCSDGNTGSSCADTFLWSAAGNRSSECRSLWPWCSMFRILICIEYSTGIYCQWQI